MDATGSCQAICITRNDDLTDKLDCPTGLLLESKCDECGDTGQVTAD